jgi:hypothetical protein
MRPLEIIIPGILVVFLMWPLVAGQRRTWVINSLPFIAIFVTVLHLIIEKYRWQMIPIYALVILCCLAGALGLSQSSGIKFKRSPRSFTTRIADGT